MPSRRILLARFPFTASHTQALLSLRNRCEARRSVRPQRPIWRTAYDSALSFPNSLCALIRFDFRVNGFALPPAKTTRRLRILPHFAQKSMNFSVDARPRCTAGAHLGCAKRASAAHRPSTYRALNKRRCATGAEKRAPYSTHWSTCSLARLSGCVCFSRTKTQVIVDFLASAYIMTYIMYVLYT